MQSAYAAHFEREMGCTLAEWQGWLGAAIGAHPWQQSSQAAQIELAPGASLCIHWTVLPERVIASVRLPRLRVVFDFAGADAALRYAFMKRFDLYMQRGGG